MTMVGSLSVTPVRPSVPPSVRHTQRRRLFKLNSFDPNFMKLGHIVKYYNVDNGPYHTVRSGVCL